MTKIMMLNVHNTDLNIIKNGEGSSKEQEKFLENFLYLKVEKCTVSYK